MLTPGGIRYERRISSGRYIEFNFKPLDDGSLLCVFRDITELQEREQALASAKAAAEVARDAAERARIDAEAANQAKSTFLATMSHEIRTPMNGVLGMIEILERQGLGEAQRRAVVTMRESAQALLHIIDDVLDFSKIEAGKLNLVSGDCDVRTLIEQVVALVNSSAWQKRLSLTSTVATSVPETSALTRRIACSARPSGPVGSRSKHELSARMAPSAVAMRTCVRRICYGVTITVAVPVTP